MRDGLVRVRGWLVVVALLVGAAVNIDEVVSLRPSARPLRPHAEDSLAHLVRTEQRTVAQRFRFYSELPLLASGGTLLAPPKLAIDGQFVTGLSGWNLREIDYEAVPSNPLAFEGFADGGELETAAGLFQVWLPPEQPAGTVFWLAVEGDQIWVVPATIAPVPSDV